MPMDFARVHFVRALDLEQTLDVVLSRDDVQKGKLVSWLDELCSCSR